jgi:formylglycine-generating enzyme required for sulfatase activity
MTYQDPQEMFQKILSILFLSLFISISLHAQNPPQLRVEGQATLDESAIIPPSKKDVNGRQVAAIKVLTNLPSLSFDSGNGVVEVQQQTGEFIVFLSPNERKLTIGASGYLPLDIILSKIGIRLQSGQLWEIMVTGEQQTEDFASDLEALIISSIPKGATVYIDGVESGKTDASFFKYPSSYRVRWVLDGYLTQEQEVEVKAGQPNQTEVTLQKNTGLFSWSISPNDAQLFINKERKQGNQLELSPSDYLVEVKKDGYEALRERITIERGQSLTRSYSLIRHTGNLLVNVSPVDAKVSISGEGLASYEFEGIKSLKQVPVGNYTVKVEKQGFKTLNKAITIENNKTLQRTFTLEEGSDDVDFTNSIGMEFVYVKAGSFQMGNSEGGSDQKPIHKVEITKDFYIGKYEVTQIQWLTILGGNPSRFNGSTLPVETVSWNDVQAFIQKMNQKEGKELYRLPTEAEWEYAARGGKQGKGYRYAGSNDINEVAWYGTNSGNKTHEVGTKDSNELGIYDMSGNVREWCQDLYSGSYYSQSSGKDPKGPRSGQAHVIRGGSWFSSRSYVGVADRYDYGPTYSSGNLGFRLLRALD